MSSDHFEKADSEGLSGLSQDQQRQRLHSDNNFDFQHQFKFQEDNIDDGYGKDRSQSHNEQGLQLIGSDKKNNKFYIRAIKGGVKAGSKLLSKTFAPSSHGPIGGKD